MIQVLEYISQNYTLFLVGLVLILLAIIGYYVDKTNFGQGKNKDKETKENIEENQQINDFLPVEKKQEFVETDKNLNPEQILVETNETLTQEQESSVNIETIDKKEISLENIQNIKNEQEDQILVEKENVPNKESVEFARNDNSINDINLNIEKNNEKIKKSNDYNLFNEEIDSLLPKEELINDDLLEEIDGMELNFATEKTSIDVPNFENIRLPKIKNLVEKEQDIWKF